MSQTFEKAGYVTSAPTAWLHKPGAALRMTVPCVPLTTVLGVVGITRLDVMWLDVEGGERHVLRSIDWTVSAPLSVYWHMPLPLTSHLSPRRRSPLASSW